MSPPQLAALKPVYEFVSKMGILLKCNRVLEAKVFSPNWKLLSCFVGISGKRRISSIKMPQKGAGEQERKKGGGGGARTYDVCKIFGVLTPSPPCHCHSHATYHYPRLLSEYPLPSPSADVMYVHAPLAEAPLDCQNYCGGSGNPALFCKLAAL